MQEFFNGDNNNKQQGQESPAYIPVCKPDNELTLEQLKKVRTHRIINIGAVAFGLALTAVALLTFFLTMLFDLIGGWLEFNVAYAIVSTYVLCMLLAAPTIKVFLDKCTCNTLKRLNVVSLIVIFAAIFVMVTAIMFAFVGYTLYEFIL